MTPAELIAAGELVYGSQWRTPLAKALGVNRRLIYYYKCGERQIPRSIAASHSASRRPRSGRIARQELDKEGRARSSAGPVPPHSCSGPG